MSMDAGVIRSVLSRRMPRTVQARLDNHAELDLALLRDGGLTDSEAVRLALHEAAARRRRRSVLRAEAALAAGDSADLAESARVREAMDELAVAWRDDS